MKLLAGYIVVLSFSFPVVSVFTKMALNEDMDLGCRCDLRVLHRGRAERQLVGQLSAGEGKKQAEKTLCLVPEH